MTEPIQLPVSTRRIVLIGLGLIAATAIGVLAAQLLALGLGWDPPVTPSSVATATEQVRSARQPGSAMLVGLGLVLAALALAALWLTDLVAPRRRSVTMRKRGGVTRVDRPSLEASLERELNHVDGRTSVDVSVTRRGRARVVVHTADPTRTGPVHEVTERLAQLVSDRHLPVTVKRVAVAPATGKARRKRVA